MPPDGNKCALREHGRQSSSVVISVGAAHTAANGHSSNHKRHGSGGTPRASDQRRGSGGGGCRPSQLLAKQYAVYWVVWLVLCGCFAIRHTTRLLDAAGSQHHLLAPPKGLHWGSAATQQQHVDQHHSSNSNADDGSSTSTSRNGSTTAGILAAQKAAWPDGYVAVCAVIKDQWPDLRYWIEYHRWLGVSKFYIYDNNSTMPAMLMLWDYMQQGVVDYEYFLGHPRHKPDFRDTNQYRAYQNCLLQHFKQHRWLAFIDADEFLVFPEHNNTRDDAAGPSSSSSSSTNSSGGSGSGSDSNSGQQPESQSQQHDSLKKSDTHLSHDLGSSSSLKQPAAAPADNPTTLDSSITSTSTSIATSNSSSSNYSSMYGHSLPLFLSEFEGAPAVGVNWVLFGSSGHVVRPAQGPLAAFTSCIPRTHWESTHVKVIANTAGVLGLGYTPHEVLPRNGKGFIVDVDLAPFRGPKTPHAKWHKLVLHHYVLKSKAEFVAKKARGSGAGNRKDWAYWDYVEKLATDTCTEGLAASAAFLASKPQLGLPQAAHVLQDCHKRAAAAYEALLVKPLVDGSTVQGKQQQQSAGAAGQDVAAISMDELVPC